MTYVTHPKMVTHLTHDPLTHFHLCFYCCNCHTLLGRRTQVAVDLLRWNRSETHFLLVGRVFYSPLNNFRSIRDPVHCVVATLGLMVRYEMRRRLDK